MSIVVISIIFFVVVVITIKIFPKGNDRTNLGFIPVEGERSHYTNCYATDIQGKYWKSADGSWIRSIY